MKFSGFFPLIGVAIFAYLLMNIDLQKTWEILTRADLLFIFPIPFMVAVVLLMKALKWKLIIDLYGTRYPLKDSLKAWTMGFSLSMMTPARMGDLTRAYYIKGETGLGRGLTTVIIDRVIDIGILFCLAILGFLSFMTLFTQYSNLFLTVAVLFALFVLAVYVSTKKSVIGFFLKPVFGKIVPEKHKSGLHMTFHEFYSGLDIMRKRKRQILLAVLLGVSAWMASIFQYFLFAMSLGLAVPFVFLLSVVPIVALLDTLPVSFSGIGTRDAALILFFSFISVQKEYAISVSLLVLFFGYVLVGLVGAFFFLKGEHRKMTASAGTD